MPRWVRDDIDDACESWAFQWVQSFGKAPDRASRYIGPLGSTLGRVLQLHDGASSNTTRDQHLPEVFLGQGLIVAIALKAMSERSRELIHRHYVARWYEPGTWARRSRPVKQAIIAADLGVSPAEYYRRRDCAKQCIAVVLSLGVPEKPLATRAEWPLPSAGLGVQRVTLAAG